MSVIVRLAAVIAALAISGAAVAQPGQPAAQYPTKSVRVIVPYPAGGPTDVIGRMVAQHLSEALGQQFYVENVAGAGGVIGFTTAARAPADGYTLLITTNDVAVAPATTKNLQFDAKSFTPISIVASTPQVVVVHPSIPAKDMKELVALIKSEPTKYNYASMSVGFGQLTSVRMFQLGLGLNIPRVPFSGAAPMMTSILGNQTPIAMIGLPPAAPHIKAGKMRALGLSRRSEAFPDVPTFAEQGYPNQDADLVIGVVAPAGTPKAIVDLIQAEVAKAVVQPAVKTRLDALGFTGVASTPEAYAEMLKSDAATWPRVMEAAGIKPN